MPFLVMVIVAFTLKEMKILKYDVTLPPTRECVLSATCASQKNDFIIIETLKKSHIKKLLL